MRRRTYLTQAIFSDNDEGKMVSNLIFEEKIKIN